MAEEKFDILEYLYPDPYKWTGGTIDPADEDLTLFDYNDEIRLKLERLNKPGEILKEVKKVTEGVSEYDWKKTPPKLWQSKSSERKADKAAQLYKQKLIEKLESQGYISDDSYRGAQDRFDRPPKMMEEEMEETKRKALHLSMGEPESKYTGPFGKLGEYFSKNAKERDKLFSMIGSMGRELVKPIEPGEEAAGALVPTLSKGMKVGAEEYAAQQTAGAETALKLAEARQKMNPMQYMSNAMTDAIGYVEGLNIDPRTPKGKAMIAKYLLTVGVNDTVVALNTALGDAREELQNYEQMGGTDKNKIKAYEQDIQNLRNKLNNVLLGDLGGSGVTETFTDRAEIESNI